jgi:hypothetical protein
MPIARPDFYVPWRRGLTQRKRQKSKGKRQKAKGKSEESGTALIRSKDVFIFAFCLLPFAF